MDYGSVAGIMIISAYEIATLILKGGAQYYSGYREGSLTDFTASNGSFYIVHNPKNFICVEFLIFYSFVMFFSIGQT